MAYFEQQGKLTFTKSFQGLRRHCYKCILLLLLMTLILFVIVSTLQNWFTVTLSCRSNNGTAHSEKYVFGVKDICVRNETFDQIICKSIASFQIPGTTRKYSIMVVFIRELTIHV